MSNAQISELKLKLNNARQTLVSTRRKLDIARHSIDLDKYDLARKLTNAERRLEKMYGKLCELRAQVKKLSRTPARVNISVHGDVLPTEQTSEVLALREQVKELNARLARNLADKSRVVEEPLPAKAPTPKYSAAEMVQLGVYAGVKLT